MSNLFLVFGGIYTDFSFKRLEDNPQFAGPFFTYEDAYAEWKRLVWQNVDNALHKLEIKTMVVIEDHELD